MIMNDTPEWASLTWDFNLSDGGVFFDSSNEFEVLFLSQSPTSSRLTAGVQLQDLSVQWGYGFTLELDYDFPIFVDVRVFEASAGIFSNSGVDGFFAQYDWVGSPSNLQSGTMPNGGEYVPQFTAMMRDFTKFEITLGIDFSVFPDINPIPSLDLDIDGPTGQFVFDVWDTTGFEEIVTVPLFDFDIGIKNVAD